MFSDSGECNLIPRLTCCATEIWLTVHVIQPCYLSLFSLYEYLGMVWQVTGQFVDTPTCGLPTRELDKSRTGQLAVLWMQPALVLIVLIA